MNISVGQYPQGLQACDFNNVLIGNKKTARITSRF